MLVRLDLVLTTETGDRMVAGQVAGLVGENVEDTKSPGISVIYMVNGYNNKPFLLNLLFKY